MLAQTVEPWTERQTLDVVEGLKTLINMGFWMIGWWVAGEFLPSARMFFGERVS